MTICSPYERPSPWTPKLRTSAISKHTGKLPDVAVASVRGQLRPRDWSANPKIKAIAG